MDKPDGVDVDLPEVDGVPIPPYEPLSYPNTGPISKKAQEWGLIIVIALVVIVPTILCIAVWLKGT